MRLRLNVKKNVKLKETLSRSYIRYRWFVGFILQLPKEEAITALTMAQETIVIWTIFWIFHNFDGKKKKKTSRIKINIFIWE